MIYAFENNNGFMHWWGELINQQFFYVYSNLNTCQLYSLHRGWLLKKKK